MRSRVRLTFACAVLAALAGLVGSASAKGSVPLPTAVVAKDVLLQSDGRIVVSVETPATDRFTVVRLRPDGSLDPSFGGGDGVAEIIIEPTRTAVVKDLALQPDGRIIASGHVMKDQTDSKFVLVRLRSDGSPDPTFSGDGKVITDFVTRNGWNPSVALTKDGSIVAAGSDFTGAGILVARYRSDGTPEPTFDVDGMAIIDLPGPSEEAYDAAVDQAGNAVVAGRNYVQSVGPDNFLARVRPDGHLDPSFGLGGVVVWNAGEHHEAARSVAVQGDGRIVVAGTTDDWSSVTLARYLPSGQPDQSFGEEGYVVSALDPAPSLFPGVVDLALLRDGRIAVSSTYSIPSAGRVQVVTSSGAPDHSFDGDDGVVELKLGGPDRWDDGGFLAVTRDGKLVVAGTHRDQNLAPGILEVVAVPSIAPVADVAPTIEAAPNPASAGPVEFLVHVRNNGPGGASGVALRFEATQATGEVRTSQGECSSPLSYVTTCALGSIPVGEEAIVSVTTTVTGFEEGLFGTATVTSSSIDLDTGNDTATAEVVINPT